MTVPKKGCLQHAPKFCQSASANLKHSRVYLKRILKISDYKILNIHFIQNVCIETLFEYKVYTHACIKESKSPKTAPNGFLINTAVSE